MIEIIILLSISFYIVGRVTLKSDIVTWNKTNGDGSLFYIHLLDAAGGQIKATFFNEACYLYCDALVKGNVYMFVNGIVKNSEFKKHSIVNNQFELSIPKTARIIATYDNGSIKQQHLNLVKLDRVADCPVNSVVDVIGIVRSVGESITVKSHKSNTEFMKREITLVDETNVEIKVALWGADAEKRTHNWKVRPIVCIQAAVVKEFHGAFLSLTPQSILTLNQHLPEAEALCAYRDKYPDGHFPVTTCLSVRGVEFGALGETSFGERKLMEYFKLPLLPLAIADKALFVVIKGVVSSVRRQGDTWYRACSTESCGKKVSVDEKSGQFKCPKCGPKSDEVCICFVVYVSLIEVIHLQCNLRYILYATLSDHTGSYDFSLHNDMVSCTFVLLLCDFNVVG